MIKTNKKVKVNLYTESELKWHDRMNYRIDHEKSLVFNRDKVTMFAQGMTNLVNEADYSSDLITDATYEKYNIVNSDNAILTIIFKLGICSKLDIIHIGGYINRLYDKRMVAEECDARLINLCKCGLLFCFTYTEVSGKVRELYSLTRAGNSLVYHQNAKIAEDGVFSNRYDDDFSFYSVFESLKFAEASKATANLIKYYSEGVKYKNNSSFYDAPARKNYKTYGFFNATIGEEEKYILIEPWKTSYPEGTFVHKKAKGDFITFDTYSDNRIDNLKRIIRLQPTRNREGTNDNFKMLFVCEDEKSIKDLYVRLNNKFEDSEKETVLITSSVVFSSVNIMNNAVFYRFNDDKLEPCAFFEDFTNKQL